MADGSEIRAGLFVVVALAILGTATLWVVGFSPFRGPKVEYEVVLQSSSGVRRGDRVRVAGVEVGRVKELELRAGEAWPVRLLVGLDGDVALTEGSTARITSDGLLGAPYLQIEAGPSDASQLPPGSRIEGQPSGDLTEALAGLDDITERLPGLLDQVSVILGKVDGEIEPILAGIRGVVSQENVESISAALATLQPTLDELRPKLMALLEHLDAVAGRVDGAVAGVPDLTAEIAALAESLRTAAGEDGARIRSVLENADAALGSAGGAFSTVEGNRAELDAMIRDLREAAANLRSVSQMLKEHPAMLLRYPRPAERTPGGGERP